MKAATLRLQRVVEAGHPAFAGHFPGVPLWPGVCLLAEVFEAVRADAALAACLGPRPGIAAAKFLAPVRPGQQITIAIDAQVRGAAFEIHRGDTLVANGRLEPGGMPDPR